MFDAKPHGMKAPFMTARLFEADQKTEFISLKTDPAVVCHGP